MFCTGELNCACDLACSVGMRRQCQCLARRRWVVMKRGLLCIYVLSKVVARAAKLMCLCHWLARDQCVIRPYGLHKDNELSKLVACLDILGCHQTGLHTRDGLSRRVACSQCLGSPSQWLDYITAEQIPWARPLRRSKRCWDAGCAE